MSFSEFFSWWTFLQLSRTISSYSGGRDEADEIGKTCQTTYQESFQDLGVFKVSSSSLTTEVTADYQTRVRWS